MCNKRNTEHKHLGVADDSVGIVAIGVLVLCALIPWTLVRTKVHKVGACDPQHTLISGFDAVRSHKKHC